MRDSASDTFGSTAGAWVRAVAVALALSPLVLALPAAGQESSPNGSVSFAEELRQWQMGLEARETPPQQRAELARRLVAAGSPETDLMIAGWLIRTDRPEVVSAICAALAETEPIRETLTPAVVDGLRRAPAELRDDFCTVIEHFGRSALHELEAVVMDLSIPTSERIVAIEALGRLRLVEVVDQLVALLDAGEPAEIEEAARAALVRITGRDFETHEQWRRWWSEHRRLGREGLLEQALRRLTASVEALTDQMVEAESRARALEQELLVSLEREYVLSEPAERDVVLVRLLSAERVAVRSLGLNLVQRRMSNAEPVPAPVVEAVANCASHGNASIRASALQRLLLLDGVRASAVAAASLPNESDPAARSAMLAALEREPVDQAIEYLLSLYSSGDLHAAPALAAAARRSMWTAQRSEAMCERLQARSVAELSRAEAELLGWCEGDWARNALSLLLAEAAPSERAVAAARGLAQSGRFDDLLRESMTRADSFGIAVAALASRHTPEQTAADILARRPDDVAALLTGVEALYSGLSPEAALAVDQRLAVIPEIPIGSRAEWLHGVQRRAAAAEPGDDPVGQQALRDLCLHLAAIEHSAGRAVEMLRVIEAAPVVGEAADDAELSRLRMIAEIALGTFARWDSEELTPAVALAGLELLLRQGVGNGQGEKAVEALGHIDRRFSDSLDESQRSAIETLRVRIAEAFPQPAPEPAEDESAAVPETDQG